MPRLQGQATSSAAWSTSVDAIMERAPRAALAPHSLAAQIRLLALLGTAAPLNVLLEGLARYVETWADGMLCSVMLVDPGGNQLRPAAAPSLHPDYVRAMDPVGIKDGVGSCGTAAARRALVIVEDVEQSPLWEGIAPMAVAHGLRACWSMPVFDADDRLLATLAIYYRTPRRPTDQEVELIQFAALLAAMVIQRHRDSERLRASEARLEAAVGGSDIGLWDWRVGADSLAWLSDWPRRKGINVTADHTTMAELLEVVHPEDRQRLIDDVEAVVAAGRGSVETEYRFMAMRREYRWLQVRARVIERNGDGRAERVVGACIDVDQRRHAEEQLRTQAKILDTMNEGVVLIDLAGRIELTNPAFDRMFGREPGQHFGQSMLGLLSYGGPASVEPPDIERLMQRVAGRSNRSDVLFRRADGSEFTAEMIAEAISLASGQKWLLVLQDVSERKQLEREVLDIANRERHRLGSDLHDGLGQELTGVALLLCTVATHLQREAPAAVPQIDGIVGLVNHAIESTRAMARGLAPVSIDQGGLGSALEELASRSRAACGVQVRFRRAVPADLQIGEDTANHLYRITQEAISNSVRHGRAAHVVVTLRERLGQLELTVSDDGVGFTGQRAHNRGMGLKIMKYRARMIGGTIDIQPRRSGGTRVRCVCQSAPGLRSW